MNLSKLVGRSDVRIFAISCAFAVAIFGTAFAVAAPGGDEKSAVPIETAAPTLQIPDSAANTLPQLPFNYRGTFNLVPVGTVVERVYQIGDERDTWSWAFHEAASIADVPADPDIVREPVAPAGYTLSEISYVAGIRPDGSFGQLSELHFAYEAPAHVSIFVHIWRPTEFAVGAPWPIVVPTSTSATRVKTTEVAGLPSVYEFQDPERPDGGRQLLHVADGHVMIEVESSRGVPYADFVGIVESIVKAGAR